jgi:hypothetical protein
MIHSRVAPAVLTALVASVPAHAAVTISTAATQNMDCSGGTCVPTATDAVLNVSDLENFLSQFGNVRVSTTGTGVEANNIMVDAAFTSPDSTSLALDAHDAIAINAAVSIGSGTADLELQSGSNGTFGDLSFAPGGNITFGSTSDTFGINGVLFQLVASLPSFAAAVKMNDGGIFALANGYDASADGTYHTPPVRTKFRGYLEGLGNTISNLSVKDYYSPYVGLFADVFGGIRNLRLTNVDVKSTRTSFVEVGGIIGLQEHGASLEQSSVTGRVTGADTSQVGGLVGGVGGTLSSSWSSTKVVTGVSGEVGGLAGGIDGSIVNSYAVGTVESGTSSNAGGLVGSSDGSIITSFAKAAVRSGDGSDAGGLIGVNFGVIKNSYAEGKVADTGVGNMSYLGGLVGENGNKVSSSYSTGTVTGSGSDVIGGVVGFDNSGGGFSDTYWDTTTSGLSQGAGNINNDSGLTGLTSSQLQSGLPPGFDKKIWREKGKTNHGFPYLIDNPPPK